VNTQEEIVRTACPRDCYDTCGVAVHMRNGAIQSVRGDPDHREVPRPPLWTGFRVRPDAIEFSTHREHRLHDREIYLRYGPGWRRNLLQP
jgi:pyridoxine/pyridoxamine 5'-phosphate oxidase